MSEERRAQARDSVGEPCWWQRAVIYEIYPRSFQDTDGDGVGDLPGIIARLDYLNDGTERSLGIDAVWISPFYPSPMADFGYDVSDYRDVHPLFGTLADFDRLLAEAHRRGIRVLVDFVPNHTSDRHPWFEQSRRSRRDPRRHWYIWRDPAPGGGPPNNWGAVFGGSAWEWDEATGQYYLHSFLKEQPDLSWRNPEVVAAMRDVLRFWLARGVDGFRIDVVHMILKDAGLPDNPADPAAPLDLPENDIYHRQLNVYNQDLDEVHGLIRLLRETVDEFPDRVCIGEVWGHLTRWIKYYGARGEGLNLPFNFRLIERPWTAESVRKSIMEMEAALESFAWPNYVLGNHDVPRLASRVGPGQARVAAMLLLTLRGTPTLYYGDELGLENGVIPPDRLRDPQGLRLGAGRTRDVCRTPMPWTDGPGGGFSQGEPWLPFAPERERRNVAAMEADPRSLLHLYRRLLHLRRRTPALQDGTWHLVETTSEAVLAYERRHRGARWLVALNFSPRPVPLLLDPHPEGRIVLASGLDREPAPLSPGFVLAADEGILVELPPERPDRPARRRAGTAWTRRRRRRGGQTGR